MSKFEPEWISIFYIAHIFLVLSASLVLFVVKNIWEGAGKKWPFSIGMFVWWGIIGPVAGLCIAIPNIIRGIFVLAPRYLGRGINVLFNGFNNKQEDLK